MRAVLLFGILLFCGIAFSEVIQEDPKDDAPVVNSEGESENDLQSESDDVIDEDDESKETAEGSESDTEQEEIEEDNDTALEDEETQDEEDSESEVEDPKRHRPSRQCKAT